jgi:hypothetical protein
MFISFKIWTPSVATHQEAWQVKDKGFPSALTKSTPKELLMSLQQGRPPVGQNQPSSMPQTALHPSPSKLFPSSQASEPVLKPSPQMVEQYLPPGQIHPLKNN